MEACFASALSPRPVLLNQNAAAVGFVTSTSNTSRQAVNKCRVTPSVSLATTGGSREYEREELNEDVDSFAYLVNTVQCMLHFKYRASNELDENDSRLLLEEVLRFHPRANDKIGCGFGSLLVEFHPEYRRSRCFMIKRTDNTTCDFSYRKCMIERARLKGIDSFVARKLLNMDYMDLTKAMP